MIDFNYSIHLEMGEVIIQFKTCYIILTLLGWNNCSKTRFLPPQGLVNIFQMDKSSWIGQRTRHDKVAAGVEIGTKLIFAWLV